jgi:L,D-transpeptidase catalytic domain
MSLRSLVVPSLAAACALVIGCSDAEEKAPSAEPATSAGAAPIPSSEATVEASAEAAPKPQSDKPLLGARAFATTVYAEPKRSASKLGYLRVGAKVPRSAEQVSRRGCKGGWYAVEPKGFVCAGEGATIDMRDPLLRAAATRPNRDRPLPYRYGFVRSVLPMYLRVPSSQQQFKSEFKLEEHLEWFKEHKDEIQKADLGAYDVAVDAQGRNLRGKALGALGRDKNSSEMGVGELFGASGNDDPWPFWLRDNERLIPNISGFDVPDYAVFADRARRHTGLAFIGSFPSDEHHLRRRFAITTDLRLAPTTKVKPDSASPWHGVELGGDVKLPLAFVARRGAQAYRLSDGSVESVGDLKRRSAHGLSGKVKLVEGERYVQFQDGKWAKKKMLGLALTPSKFPRPAQKGRRWVQVNIGQQTLTLWEGKTPVFTTLVSTGRPQFGDPDETTASPRGIYSVYAKHVSATMDADEGAGQRLNKTKALKPGDPGYVPSKGDGQYGVTLRRGHGLFKLRDVPYIQYFHRNYAIHAAYWHDVFGIARSHGCINLAPADALRVFKFTDPQVPEGWHGVRVPEGKGTPVVLHK